MKKAHLFILVFFYVILISVPFYWLVRGKPESQVSIIEGRVLGLPERNYPTLKTAINYIQQGKPELAIALVWDLYTSGALQKKFDGAATDQFPFRMPLITFSKSIDRRIIQLTYSFSDDKVIPANMTSDIHIVLDEDALIFSPNILDDNSFKNIDKRIDNYQEIITAYPNINFYIFYLETLEFSYHNPLNQYFAKADHGQSYEYFQANLPKNIELKTFRLENFDAHLFYFYRTDHHWNVHGIIKAYNTIYELLSNNYVNIPQKLTPSALITFPNIEFLGTLARRTLYPVKGDAFTGYNANFPTCEVSDQGIKGNYDFRDEYLRGEYSTTPYITHYGLYFGSQSGLIEYDCETETERNILIIGNSYIRPLVALIANHYSHTYFLDLRQDENFTLSNFLRDHHVDDILFAGNSNVLYLDTNQWMIKP